MSVEGRGLRGLRRLESAATAVERGLIVTLLAVMAGAVFLDALHRIFAADEGRLERLLALVAPGAAEVLAAGLLLLATFGVSYGALRTRGSPRRRALLIAAGVTAALTAGTRLLLLALPSGLVWSQQMALCLMLWVGLTGASLATRDRAHIAFELAGKIWPSKLRVPVERLARVVAAAFSLFLAVLAAAYTREHFLEWSSTGGQAGLFEAFRVPRWVIFGYLPLPLTVMALRFAVYGVRAPEESS